MNTSKGDVMTERVQKHEMTYSLIVQYKPPTIHYNSYCGKDHTFLPPYQKSLFTCYSHNWLKTITKPDNLIF